MITSFLMLYLIVSPPPIPDLSFLVDVKPPAMIEIKVEKEKVKL